MILFVLLAYTVPLDSPYMEYIEYLQVRGLLEVPSLRPYKLGWIVEQINYLLVNDAGLTTVDRTVLSKFAPLVTKNEDFSYLVHGQLHYAEPEYYRGFMDYRGGGRLAAHTRFSHGLRLQRASDIDTAGPKPWKDFQAFLTEGMVPLVFLRGAALTVTASVYGTGQIWGFRTIRISKVESILGQASSCGHGKGYYRPGHSHDWIQQSIGYGYGINTGFRGGY